MKPAAIEMLICLPFWIQNTNCTNYNNLVISVIFGSSWFTPIWEIFPNPQLGNSLKYEETSIQKIYPVKHAADLVFRFVFIFRFIMIIQF